MSYDWSDYYKFAQELAAKPNDASLRETYLRNCISRAYYSAFCSARNHLRKEGITFVPGGSVHTKVKLAFFASTEKRRRAIGRNLSDLGRFRNECDYEDSVKRLSKKAKSALKMADEVLNDLAAL